MPSTRSTASGSRSSSPTTCCPATGPARSWPSPRTTSATSRSPSSSGCRSGASSPRPARTPTTPMDGRLHRPRRRRAPGQQRRVRRAARPTRAARRSSRDWPSSGAAEPKVTYRLRDWLISRQRYWGTPIPVVYCRRDGIVPVRDEDLPVRLPEDVDYQGSGDNPLTKDEAFLHTTCPQCGGPARRETDTMDTFIDSSWYWFRYLSPEKAGGPVDRALVDRWTPVDQYTGGAEHAVMHLMYSRFWTKAMRDVGLVGQDEPFLQLFNQGQILGADGERMSKSRGQRPGPGRAGRALRRRHRPAVPDVHGPVGPGRPVEPDRDRRRPSLPEPGLDRGPRPARPRGRATRTPATCRPARPRPTRREPCAPRRIAPCAT